MVKAVKVISDILDELDKTYTTHQDFYRWYHSKEDETAKLIHHHLVELCKTILKEIEK